MRGDHPAAVWGAWALRVEPQAPVWESLERELVHQVLPRLPCGSFLTSLLVLSRVPALLFGPVGPAGRGPGPALMPAWCPGC